MQPPPTHTQYFISRGDAPFCANTQRMIPYHQETLVSSLQNKRFAQCLFVYLRVFFVVFFFDWESWIHLTFKKGSWSHKFTRSDAKQQTNEMNIKPINNLTPALVLSVLSQHYHRRLNTMPPRFEFPSVQWYLNKGDIICIQFSNAQSNRYSCIFFY